MNRMIGSDLRSNRVRTALTAFSMYLGVLALCAVATAESFATTYVVAVHEQLRGREATYVLTLPWDESTVERTQALVKDLDSRLSPQGGYAVLELSNTMRVSSTARSVEIEHTQITGEPNAVYRRPVTSGTYMPVLHEYLADVMVLNEAGAQALAIPHLPHSITVDPEGPTRRSVAISAIIADGLDSPQLYGALSASSLVESGTSVQLRLVAPTSDVLLVNQMVKTAAGFHGVPIDSDVSRADTVEEARSSVVIVGKAFTVCGLIALVVSAIGILNVGLSSVRERSREFVIRRALGARKVDIMGQVLAVNVAVSFLVFVAAVLTLVATVGIAAPLVEKAIPILDPLSVSWGSIAIGGIAAVSTALVSGMIPALSASRLDVADALRT